jgi:CubicO group peptidase (beta-lactamase class C family)
VQKKTDMRFFKLLTTLLLSTTLTAQPLTLDATELQKGFDELIERHTAADNFRGRVIVDQGGETIYARDNGLANFKTKRPYTDATRLAIGSVSKVFTATAVLLLEQDGKLSFDDPIADHLPELARFPKVTIEHLLTHSGGLAYDALSIRHVMKLKKGEENTLSIILKRIENDYLEPGVTFI